MAERIGGSMRRTAGGLSRRFMMAVAAGVLVLAVAVLMLLFLRQQAELESRLGQLSQNELSSLEALTVSVMNKRPEDPENVAIAVFDAWFARRNADYNGAVWTAWGPKVAAYKKEPEPAGPSKPPRDAVDEEALATGRPVGRF